MNDIIETFTTSPNDTATLVVDDGWLYLQERRPRHGLVRIVSWQDVKTVEIDDNDDELAWQITLRGGLRFSANDKVIANGCIDLSRIARCKSKGLCELDIYDLKDVANRKALAIALKDVLWAKRKAK